MKYEEARRILRSLSRKFQAQGELKYARALVLGEKCIGELSRLKSRKSDGAENESLVQELVGVIDDLCRQINQCGLDEQMWEVYRRAKEVLGNEDN